MLFFELELHMDPSLMDISCDVFNGVVLSMIGVQYFSVLSLSKSRFVHASVCARSSVSGCILCLRHTLSPYDNYFGRIA